MGRRKRSPEDIAEQRIAEALRKGVRRLDLRGLGLTALPDSLGSLTQLTELDLTGNQLTSLPESLGNLTLLTYLNLSSNQLTSLPQSLRNLTQLTLLNLTGNQLTVLPESIGDLTQLTALVLMWNQLTSLPVRVGDLTRLTALYLNGNRLTSLPDGLGNLTQLIELNLDENQLTSLPESLRNLTQVKALGLRDNQVTSLPESLRNLTQLTYLYLDSNQLTSLPESLGNLTLLTYLNLSSNQLTSLPQSLRNLTQLTHLYLHENPGLGLPAEVLGPTGQEQGPKAAPAAILEYYFRSRAGARPLNEAKLILVGRGTVGKTCLVNQLVHDKFADDTERTPGIQITDWKLPVDGQDIGLHVWDFGGQEIMHATHQFFLTERSLYLLVLNGRDGWEDHDVEYWLKLISSFGGDSPVIVVLNKIREFPCDLNYRDIRRKYPQVRGFVKTDCKESVGISELRSEIAAALAEMPDVKAAFPAAWFSVKDRLGGMKASNENYITYDRYREICQGLGETEETAQDHLAGFLHCLGIALNYRDDDRLRETSLLNPHWVTNGIYKVLNAESLADRKGVLSLGDLARILPADLYPRDKQAFIVELMRKFNLCFSFHDSARPRYLVPELLDKQEPELGEEFDGRGCLNFEYRYPVLPEGLLPSFIVRSNVLSEGQPRWRSGVVLQWNACRALVKADTGANRITISVNGPTPSGRRELLAVIRSDFDRMHGELRTLRVTPSVPVPEYPGFSVEYDKLVAFERKGISTFDEYVDGEPIRLTTTALLGGVDLPSAPGGKRAPLKAFISYAHEDEPFRARLEVHLKLLEREKRIALWHDHLLQAGTDWDREIDRNLESAEIILLLVSADFLASGYIRGKEMRRALQRSQAGEAYVFPIILNECGWQHTALSKLQALPEAARPVALWENQESAWNTVTEELWRLVEPEKPAPPEPPSDDEEE